MTGSRPEGYAMSAELSAAHGLPSEPARRDFLKLVTMATAAIGGAAVAWAFIGLDESRRRRDRRGRTDGYRCQQAGTRPADRHPVARQPDRSGQSNAGCPEDPATAEPRCSSERPKLERRATAQLCPQLASIDQARVCGVGRHLHTSRLPAVLFSHAEPDRAGRRIGRAGISAPVMARNTIWQAASTQVCPRRTTSPCRPIISPVSTSCASAKTRRVPPSL